MSEVIPFPLRAYEEAPDEPAVTPAPLKGGGDGDNYGGMDPWQTSVDRQLGQIHGDMRDMLRFAIGGFVLTFSAIIASFFLLSAKIEASTDKLGAKIDGVTAQLSDVKSNVAVLNEQAKPKP